MPFLTDEDYLSLIKTEIRTVVTDGSGTVQGAAELAAQELMEGYLRQRYNTTAVFSATGANRNPLIVMYMCDIALYEMHSRINPRQMPDIRVKRYDDAVAWLKAVQKGTVDPKLPLKDAESDGQPVSKNVFGGKEKFESDW